MNHCLSDNLANDDYHWIKTKVHCQYITHYAIVY